MSICFSTLIYSQILLPPNLNAPASGSSFLNPPTFYWSRIVGNAGYQVGVSANSNMNEPLRLSNTVSANTESWTPSQSQWNGLNAGQNYYWSVRTISSGGLFGNWATSRSISSSSQQLQMEVTPTGMQTVDWGQQYSFIFAVTSGGVAVSGATIPISDPIRGYNGIVTTGANGQTSYSFNVPTNTPNGDNTFNFTASKSGYTNSNQVSRIVRVSHTIQGELLVTITPQEANLAGAQWRVDGGEWLFTNTSVMISVGNHTVSFKSVPGWIEPGNQLVDVDNTIITEITGTYIQKMLAQIYHPFKVTYDGISKIKLVIAIEVKLPWNAIVEYSCFASGGIAKVGYLNYMGEIKATNSDNSHYLYGTEIDGFINDGKIFKWQAKIPLGDPAVYYYYPCRRLMTMNLHLIYCQKVNPKRNGQLLSLVMV